MRTKRILSAVNGLCLIAYASAQENAYPRTVSIWPNNVISVCWENPTTENARLRELVRQAVRETWEQHSQVRFTGWGPLNDAGADIRIRVEDDGPHTKGLGKELRNKPQGMVLNFTYNNWSQSCKKDIDFCTKAIAVHEFGHALGFAHEQNREDCEFKDCFGKEQGGNGDMYVTPCDTLSIMNYCNPDWNNKGLLSELDIKALQVFYKVPQKEAVEPMGAPEPLSLVHTAQHVAKPSGKRISHVFQLYVMGDDAEVKDIVSVTYHLHETFKNPVMVSTDRENKFSIGLRVWGEFAVSATVLRKDGTNQELKRFLDFEGTGKKLARSGGE